MDKASGIYYAQKNSIDITDEMKQTNHFHIPNAFAFTKDQELDFFLKEKKYIMKNNSMFPKVFVAEVIAMLKKKALRLFL